MRKEEEVRMDFEQAMSEGGWDLSRYSPLEALLLGGKEGWYKNERLEARWNIYESNHRYNSSVLRRLRGNLA